MLQKSIELWIMRWKGLALLLAVLIVAVVATWASPHAVALDPSAGLSTVAAPIAAGTGVSPSRTNETLMQRAHLAGPHSHSGHGSHDHGPGHDHQSCPDCSCCSCAGMSHFLPAHVRPGIIDNSAPRSFCVDDDAARHLDVRFSLLRPPRIPV